MKKRKEKRILILPVSLMLALFLLACSTPKAFVGKTISYNHPALCTCYNIPETCTTKLGNFLFEIAKSEGDNSGEYVINGNANWNSGATPRRIDTTESRFFLLLAEKGVIIDNIFLPTTGYDLRRLPFKKTSKSQPFDAVVITYRIRVVD